MPSPSERQDINQLYMALIEQAPDPIMTMDRLGTIRFVNSAAERISGYPAEDLVGKHFTQTKVLTPAGLMKVTQEFALVMAGQDRPAFELEIIRKDGERRTMEANPKFITKQDGSVNAQVIFRDVTQRKQVEETLRREHEQLVKMNNIMIDREQRIVELKREVNDLLKSLQQPPRYNT